MEWIEVTGDTIEEAEAHAIKMLGIERSDAEFEVVTEPKTSIFKSKREPARLRARIKPHQPQTRQRNRRRKPQTDKPQNRARKMNNDRVDKNRPLMDQNLQKEILNEFFEGLLKVWDLRADISFEWPRENVCEISLEGENLDSLVGRGGETLRALEHISKVILQKQADDSRYASIRLDIAGYREHREEALEEFAAKVAEEVLETKQPKFLEPMNSRDRKIVHDTVGSIEGVATISEGENFRRRVKIFLADD